MKNLSDSTHTDQEQALLKRLHELDPAAFSEAFDLYYDALYSFILYRIRHTETAEDLAAETFSQLVRHISEGRGPTSYLRAWLYRVARNLVIDEARRQSRRQQTELPTEMPSAEPGVDAQAQNMILQAQAREALERISPKQREILVMRYMEGLSSQEIADILQTSDRNVRALHNRGLEALRKELEDTGAINP